MRRPLRFGAAGLVNTALGLGIIFAAKALLGWGDLAANVAGYGVGLLASFGLNRRWTFDHDGHALPAFWRFVVSFLGAYALNLAVLFALRDMAGVDSYLAQAVAVIPYTVVFYLASARYVFARSASGVDADLASRKKRVP